VLLKKPRLVYQLLPSLVVLPTTLLKIVIGLLVFNSETVSVLILAFNLLSLSLFSDRHSAEKFARLNWPLGFFLYVLLNEIKVCQRNDTFLTKELIPSSDLQPVAKVISNLRL
jgi:hypothetical protein